MEENQRQKIMELQMLQQRAKQMEAQLEAINNQIKEMSELNSSILELDRGDKAEILAPMGKGIFVKAKPVDKDLFVNVGSNIVLKKSVGATSSIIEKQIARLEEMRKEAGIEILNANSESEKIISELS